ncbi:MAG: dTDP-4-dehydrorhamnose reductase [Salinarimonas sp.]|nr:dTDP-4-dehydrorhamnose reductase [Salinarimonas sp.]
MTLVVFGTKGQVARALRRIAPPGTRFLGREEADLTDPQTCADAICNCDAVSAVINAAAFTAVDAAETQEQVAQVVNADAPAAMARAAAWLGVPFIHISSDYVFDGCGPSPYTPDAPTGPINAYGRTKLAGEDGVRRAGGVHAIFRTSWVFSANGANFVRTMLRLSQTHNHLRVVADQIGGPTPAAALAQALLGATATLREHPEHGGVHHFTGAPDVSWADFARAIFATAGRPVVVEDISAEAYATPAARPRDSRLDCTRSLTAFGLARPDWQSYLREVCDELSQNLSQEHKS